MLNNYYNICWNISIFSAIFYLNLINYNTYTVMHFLNICYYILNNIYIPPIKCISGQWYYGSQTIQSF